MSEKKGHTVKLKYDFPSQRCCEVFLPNLDCWHRVTAREFRSWVGKRRILHIIDEHKTREEVTSEYRDYDGPTYLYGSNKKINPVKYVQHKIAFLNDKDPREAKLRPYEKHFTNEQQKNKKTT